MAMEETQQKILYLRIFGYLGASVAMENGVVAVVVAMAVGVTFRRPSSKTP